MAGRQEQAPLKVNESVHPLRRRFTSSVLNPILRGEVHQRGNGRGIYEAGQFLNNDFGLIVPYSHPEKKETMGMFAFPFSDEVMANRRIIEPVAIHQRQGWMDTLAKLHGVEFHYIITDDTLKYDKDHKIIRDYSERQAMDTAFAKRALEVLAEGGILFIAPQGGRRPNLEVPERATLGTLVAAIRRKHLEVAVLPMGIGVRGVEDYTKAKGYNLFKKIDYNIGNPEDLEDVYKNSGKDYRSIDKYVISHMLPNLVPEAYADVLDEEDRIVA